MRTKTFLVAVLTLVASIGLATAADSTSETKTLPSKVERVDRAGLTPEEWGLAMMHNMARVDISNAEITKLEVPPGNTLIGQVVDGKWALSVVPNNVLLQPTAPAASVGLEPAWDCENDDVNYWYASAYPLTANLVYPVAPNVASAGFCDGARGLEGQVNYMTFRTSGDAGGWMDLYDGNVGYYEIGCFPLYYGAPAAMAGAGAGFEQVYRTSFEASNTICYVVTVGGQPSEFQHFDSYLVNWNYYYYGDAYGSIVTDGLWTDVI